jgi:putative membrane protein
MVIDGRTLLKPLILLGLGVYFAWLVVGGTLKNYINTEFAWLSITASILFFLLGISSIVSLTADRSTSASVEHDHEHDHEHEHDHSQHDHAHNHAGSWVALGIVAIPLLLGLLVPSKPLDAAALDNTLSLTGGPGTDTGVIQVPTAYPTSELAPTPVVSGPHQATPVGLAEGQATALAQPEWNIYDWQQAFQSNTYSKEWFSSQSADIVGLVVRPDDIPSGHVVVGRWVMRHCAADAFGVGMLVSSEQAAGIPDETWVRVRGQLSVQQINNEPVLVLSATSIDDKVGEPTIPYIFPRRLETKK